MAERDPFDLCGVTIDGKYRVASVVGDGGFGVVYRGVHKGFGELIAIKCLKLPRELDEAGRAELLEKLQEEGRLLHRLSKATSGIVQALDVGACETPAGVWVPYLILEWLEGVTLGEFLKARTDEGGEGPLGLPAAIKLLDPAARALAVAHSQKIAHRDVKPANIFLSEVGGKKTAKVLDFGIAKVLSDHRGFTTALEATAQGPTAFTPRYGAPEQFNKQRGATGPWTDVFAIALVLIECASGKKALEGDDATQLYIASADPTIRPTLRARGVEASEAVEAVLKKALEIEPKNRYPDAGTFWTALEAAAGLTGNETLPNLSLKPSRPSDTTAEEDRNLETGEYAERKKIVVDADPRKAKSSATVPVESLRNPRRASRPDRRSGADVDPMSETPEGERSGERRASRASDRGSDRASDPPPSVEKRSYLGIGMFALAVAVFGGGAWFVYSTLESTKRNVTSASASTSVAKTAPKPPLVKSGHPVLSASATPSSSATLSASAETSASAAPSDSAVTPPAPGPEDVVRFTAAAFPMGEDGTETKVEKDFWLEKHEVTVESYRGCIRAKKCTKADVAVGLDGDEAKTWNPKCNGAGADNSQPMNCVTAAQAEAYCAWKGRRLPTDIEWEYAARSSRGRRYVWGAGDPNCQMACYGKNEQCIGGQVVSCSVGKFSDDRTDEGLFDMAGNVSEWTSSGGAERIVRGGDFFDSVEALKAYYKRKITAAESHPRIGFRCAMDVDE